MVLAARIKDLDALEIDRALCVDDVLAQLRADLVESECALEEVQAKPSNSLCLLGFWREPSLRSRLALLH